MILSQQYEYQVLVAGARSRGTSGSHAGRGLLAAGTLVSFIHPPIHPSIRSVALSRCRDPPRIVELEPHGDAADAPCSAEQIMLSSQNATTTHAKLKDSLSQLRSGVCTLRVGARALEPAAHPLVFLAHRSTATVEAKRIAVRPGLARSLALLPCFRLPVRSSRVCCYIRFVVEHTDRHRERRRRWRLNHKHCVSKDQELTK